MSILLDWDTIIFIEFVTIIPVAMIYLFFKKLKGSLGNKCKQGLYNFCQGIKDFNFIIFCKNNLPESEVSYLVLGLFSFLSLILTMFSCSPEVYALNAIFLDIIYLNVLIFACVLVSYIIWPTQLKWDSFIAIFWTLALAYILIFTPVLFTMVNNFSRLHLSILLISIVILTFLVRWYVALIMSLTASGAAIKFYKLFAAPYPESYDSNIIYILLFTSATLIFFIRPKQQIHNMAEKRVGRLTHTVQNQSEKILGFLNVKKSFLSNLQQETVSSLTGIYSTSQVLEDCYDKLTDEQRKKSITSIVQGAERLTSYVYNLLDISRLTTGKFELDIRKVRLDRLVEEVVRKCKKLYIPPEALDDKQIILNLQPGIIVKCDEYLIKRSFENIIINSIQYCSQGTIEIKLSQKGEMVSLCVKDCGIGVPPQELGDIFEPFVNSSTTKRFIKGRGLGLTLVKEAVIAHGGSVIAENNDGMGSIFIISIPA